MDGVAIAARCANSICIKAPLPADSFLDLVAEAGRGRPGPVFLELPLDVQAANVPEFWINQDQSRLEDVPADLVVESNLVTDVAKRIAAASRPILLIGGGFIPSGTC